MDKLHKGILIVLSGPSGVGKDTVLAKVLQSSRNTELSVSYTTRDARSGEVDGKDYHFVSEEEFKKIAERGEMLEYANYCGNYYGTPNFKVDEKLESGMNVIIEIEVQGAMQVLKSREDAVGIFILPPSLFELRSRLINRALDDIITIEKRVSKAKEEIKMASDYDYIVVNDDINQCVDDIKKIIDVERMKSFRKNYIIDEVLNK